MDFYLWGLALHTIAVIFWVAGLLMLPRFYAYHSTAKPGGELEVKMLEAERRLIKIIMTPAMIVALILGLYLIGKVVAVGAVGIWLVIKLILVFGLMFYHGIMVADHRKFVAGERPRSEKTYRKLNEIPAIAAIIIVILVKVKPF